MPPLAFHLFSDKIKAHFGGIAQLVEHRVCNARVIGPSPFTSIIYIYYIFIFLHPSVYSAEGFFMYLTIPPHSFSASVSSAEIIIKNPHRAFSLEKRKHLGNIIARKTRPPCTNEKGEVKYTLYIIIMDRFYSK